MVYLGHVPRLTDIWHETFIKFKRGGLAWGRPGEFHITAGDGPTSLVFIAQVATQGKLLAWGAKINILIDEGQLWRLEMSGFLHVNCYSLNSVDSTVEAISGPRRYLAVYFTSAIAGSAMSYWFCKAPAVGASGAIFGFCLS